MRHMDQENSQSWSVGCSDGRQKLECRGGRATTESGCQKWFGGSARYMKSECAFNFSPRHIRGKLVRTRSQYMSVEVHMK